MKRTKALFKSPFFELVCCRIPTHNQNAFKDAGAMPDGFWIFGLEPAGFSFRHHLEGIRKTVGFSHDRF